MEKYCRITVYSHHFEVSHIRPRLMPIIKEHLDPLIEWRSLRRRGRFIKEPYKVYTATDSRRTHFRFHINQYEEFLKRVIEHRIPIEALDIKHKRMYTPVNVEYKVPDSWVPDEKRDQPRVIGYMEDPGRSKVVTLQTGGGKLQPLDSPIKVPGGWSTMGEMHIGKEVIAQDGTVTRVAAVYPQGKQKIYKVTFADGRSTEAGGEHLWRVYHPNWIPRKHWGKGGLEGNQELGYRTITTDELIKEMGKSNSRRLSVPLIESEKCEDSELLLDPWLLGVLLGDGCLLNKHLGFTSTFPDLVKKVKERMPDGTEIRSCKIDKEHRFTYSGHKRPIHDACAHYGILDHRAGNKFIPKEYLHASHRQRMELLQGLMDTDGEVNKPKAGRNGSIGQGTTSYSTISKQLALDVQYLARSLGHIAKLSPRQTYYTYKGEKRKGQPSWRVNIRTKTPKELVSVEHKASKLQDTNQHSSTLRLGIKSIEYVGEKESQCIAIEHESRLYVTDDFIVTHNTYCSLQASETEGTFLMVCVPGKYVEKWVGDLQKTVSLDKKEICVIRGSSALLSAINLALAGEFHIRYKAIIITPTTLQRFYKDWERGALRGYPIKPVDLYKTLGVGIKICDEAHENTHFTFKQDLYAHVPKIIYLSATLQSDSPFRNKMMGIQWPDDQRFKPRDFDRYIRARAIKYAMANPDAIRYLNPQRMYNHGIFEESIIKKPTYLRDYLGMIAAIVHDYYTRRMEDGQRCIVFAATVKMCELIAEHLAKTNAHLEVVSYTAETDYEELMEADISCSTILSAGTGVDIPGLRFCLLTTNISSSSANIQVVGRLRRLSDWPDVTPDFVYLVCGSNPKHMEYHEKKMKTLRPRVLSISDIESSFMIGRKAA